ncbi:unnamed protein product [Vitrella brassicaformis CCMP3155]|uniref:K Homology domain-containing protein n=1 Tax=Vitrella brassicaformis (strain CCMP3155) TaxID=1169540 RepID=A0A0G4E868_VITBC|nr:unnamed protein product [Vitrella brassicaformis CCMP3155]|eukprot:CEL91713.1 unnamed protein product [Vitrella brassicaformis CCMP3155]
MPRDYDDRDDDRNGERLSKDVQFINNGEAAFLIGKQGRTKRKLMYASGSEIEIHDPDKGGGESSRDLTLEIRGKREDLERAKMYIKLVLTQRQGPVYLDFDEMAERDDLTLLDVPAECAGYVTGARGVVLRAIEDEWGTIMLFVRNMAERDLDTGSKPRETLAIFGKDMRGRRGSELRVMSAVEEKVEGYYSSKATEYFSDREGFDTDTMKIHSDDYSYALGKRGNTRRKLAKASGCILEYIGGIAYMAGTKKERRRVKDYLGWLCEQRTSRVIVDVKGRDDVTTLNVPRDCISYITGQKGRSLREVEEKTDTFCFMDGDSTDRDTERLLIFGVEEEKRDDARRMIDDRIDDKLSGRANQRGYDRGYDDRDYGRYDNRDRRRGGRDDDRYRSRSRSPPPSRSKYDDRYHDDSPRGRGRRSPSYDRYDDYQRRDRDHYR